jgi:hypothetical protein
MTTEMDSIARGDNAPEIDCSRGDIHLSGLCWEGQRTLPTRKDRLRRTSLRFRQQQLGEADQIIPESRRQTEPGVCSTVASIVTVLKRLGRERRSQWSDCIELMDGRG